MSSEDCPSGYFWWICEDQIPEYAGCCSSDPCQGDNTGCPEEDSSLAAASSTAASSMVAASTLPLSQTWIRTAIITTSTRRSLTLSTTSSTPPTSSTAAPLITSSSTPLPSPDTHSGLTKPQMHAVIGGSAGGAVLLFLLVAFFLTWHRQKKSRQAHTSLPPLRKAPSLPTSLLSSSPPPQTHLPAFRANITDYAPRSRAYSAYSAYSPTHITPSSFRSHHSAPTLEETFLRARERRRASDGSYPGQPIFGIPHALSPDANPNTWPVNGARSPKSADATPPPAYASQQQSPTLPVNQTRMEISSYERQTPNTRYMSLASTEPDVRGDTHHRSYPGFSKVSTAATRPRRSSAQYQQLSRPNMRQVRSDGTTTSQSRRVSEPVPVPAIYEYPESNEDAESKIPRNHTDLESMNVTGREDTHGEAKQGSLQRKPVGTGSKPSLRVRKASGPLGSLQRTAQAPMEEGVEVGSYHNENNNAALSDRWEGESRIEREILNLERLMDIQSQSKARWSCGSGLSDSP